MKTSFFWLQARIEQTPGITWSVHEAGARLTVTGPLAAPWTQVPAPTAPLA